MKKNLITIFLLMTAVLLSVGASTLDEILESAKENSISYQNYALNYQVDLISLSDLEKDDKVTVSVSGLVNPLLNADNEDLNGININLSKVSVTLPNDGNTTFTGRTSLTTMYKSGETKFTAGLGVSHTFDFASYSTDKSEDLNYTSQKYSTERSNKENELKFEQNVLNTIKSILSSESSLESSRFNVERQQKAYDKLVTLKSYSEGSSTYISTLNSLNSLKSSLKAAEEQYSQLLAQYKNLTGLDWDGLDDLTAPTLSLTTYENGNTSVLLASLSAESSEESYRKALSEANVSTLRATLSADYSEVSKTYSLSGSATYKATNWDVSVTPGLDITTDGDTTPTVTISGSWNNNTSDSDKTVNKALINSQVAANNYISALTNYEMDANSYALEIINWNTKLKEAENEMEYQKLLLDNTQALYDLGLETEENLKGAEISYAKSKTDYTITIIEGLSLERDLAIFAL